MRKSRGTLHFSVAITAGLSCALVACSDLRLGRWLGTLDAVDPDAGVTDVADAVAWPDDGRDPGGTQDPGFRDSSVDVATEVPDATDDASDAWEAPDEGVDAPETFDDGFDLPITDVPPTCVSSDEECLDRIPLGPCQKAHCNTRAGVCVAIDQDDETPCDDGNACTVGDQCIQGACSSGPVREDCAGTNPCVVYGCDPAVGCTQVLLDAGDCDPESPCTINGRCEAGECVGDPDPACQCPPPDWDCSAYEDGLRCNGLLQCDRDPATPVCVLDETTVVTCDSLLDTDCLKNLCLDPEGVCEMTPVREGLPCDEGDLCTVGASCEEGLCVGGEPVSCDDGNPCTSDSCDPLVGCVQSENSLECAAARCEGGVFFPASSCFEKACPPQVGESCDDGNECTDDSCDPLVGCVQSENSLKCAAARCEGGVFFPASSCFEKACLPQVGESCDDGNECTDDACDPLDGCLHTAVLDGRVCGWDDACAVAMVCLDGACVVPEEGPCVVLSLAVGDRHTCILASTGTVKCWGHNDQGQLGLGDKVHRGDAADEMGTALPAVDLGTGQTPTAVGSGSNHTCALLLGGRVKCWGGNEWGQLGLGDKVHRGDGPGEMGDDLPHVDLGTDIKAIAISVGSGHTCALLEGGGVKCWGAGWNGALGLGDGANRGDDPNEMGDSLPTIDLGLDRTAVAISAGPGRSCAILDNGQLKCWGNNNSGALGLGDTVSRGNAPDQMGEDLPAIDLGTGHTATAISTNANHTCAILDTAQVKCWGRNSDCQLGLEGGVDRGDEPNEMGDLLPTIDLGTDRTAVAITGGQYFTCAHLDNAQVKCWGNNVVGSLGTGTGMVTLGCNPAHMGDNLPAVALGEGRVALDVAGGAGGFSGLHACALLDSGDVKCWGYNSSGQLGLGDTANRGVAAEEMGDGLPVVDLGLCGPPHAPDGMACDDGEPCTAADVCQSGRCFGTPYSCNDDDECTLDLCDGDGGCINMQRMDACRIDGVCREANQANPDNPCEVCVPEASQATWTRVADGTICEGGTCRDGECISMCLGALGLSGMPDGPGEYRTGSGPESIAVGDLNGDGAPDLVNTNTGNNTISVWLNQSDGLFLPKVDYQTGSTPRSVAIGDLNGDGIADLAVANYDSDSLSIFLNVGDGSFVPRVDYGTWSEPRSVAIGDLNGDGAPDLAVALPTTDRVGILLNEGDGAFVPMGELTTGSAPWNIAIGDVDANGSLDLVSANWGNAKVSVILNQGSGLFKAHREYGVGAHPWSVVLEDLNGDGTLDLAIADNDGDTVSVLWNTGQGMFADRVAFSTGMYSHPRGLAGGDLNDDGMPDLVASNQENDTVGVLLNNGDGTFGSGEEYGVGDYPAAVVIADFDGDGARDIAVTSTGRVNELTVLKNDGDGRFAAKIDHYVGWSPQHIAVEDFDSDGKRDLAILLTQNKVKVLLSDDSGTFSSEADYPTGSSPESVATGDFNGDGKPDLAIANYYVSAVSLSVSVLMNNGDGSFAARLDYPAGEGSQSVAVGDFDGDGWADIAVANQVSDSVSILLNRGDGTFSENVDYEVGDSPRQLAVSDLDGDGSQDLVVAGHAGNRLVVLMNNGNGTFQEMGDYRTTANLLAVAIDDLNSDGWPDVVVGHTGPSRSVRVFMNRGDGTFVNGIDYPVAAWPSSVSIVDLNGDGSRDFAVANSASGTISVLLNDGDGDFPVRKDYRVGGEPGCISQIDLDEDGFSDLVVSNSSSDTVSILMNTCLPAPSCDDGSPCTTGDSWDVLAQACVYANANEGGACGTDGQCVSGKCLEPLWVVPGEGGTVMSGTGGIDCGVTCTTAIERGRQVTLYAMPDPGRVFSGWSGDCSGTAPCVLLMSAARTVTATFDPE